jgi:hypothetical protein
MMIYTRYALIWVTVGDFAYGYKKLQGPHTRRGFLALSSYCSLSPDTPIQYNIFIPSCLATYLTYLLPLPLPLLHCFVVSFTPVSVIWDDIDTQLGYLLSGRLIHLGDYYIHG